MSRALRVENVRRFGAVWLGCALVLAACGPSSVRQVSEVIDPSVGYKSPDAGKEGNKDGGRDAPRPSEGMGGDGGLVVITPSGADAAADASPGGTSDPEAPDAGAPVTKPVGTACSAGDECASGFCVDGVCCASGCTDRCHACNLAGLAGQCTPVPAGEDPRAECGAEPVATCGRDGTCDGEGACRLHPANTECEPGGCANASTERAARLCDGKGVCGAAGTRACSGTACQNGSCATTCTNAQSCLAGFFCAADRTCQLKRPAGQACTGGLQCASGVCSGGVCCNVACDRACVSCTLPGKVGTCSPVPAGEDPGDRCAPEAAATCGRDGSCDGMGQCRLHAATTECAAATCTAAGAVAARRCDGRGSCPAGARNDCGAFACAGVSCAQTCTAEAGCATGFVCNGGTCTRPGLLLHWRFDEETGTAARDASGTGHDGSFLGPPTPSQSTPPTKFFNPRSRAFSAARRDAAVITPHPAGLRPGAALTLALWYQSRGIETGGAGAELVSLGNNHLLRLLPGGFEVSKRARLATTNQHVRCFSSPARTDHLDGNWHHLATVIDAASVRIFFDGNLVCTLPSAEPLAYDEPGVFAVGRHAKTADVYDLDGALDDVRVYGRALDVDEIAALARGEP